MNPKFVAAFFSGLLALAVGVIVLFSQQCGKERSPDEPVGVQGPATGENGEPILDIPAVDTPELPAPEPVDEPALPQTFATPTELLDGIAQALETNDEALIARLQESAGLTEAQLADLTPYRGNLLLKRPGHIVEIGELRRNEAGRYAIELEDGRRLYFDLSKKKDAPGWAVEQVVIPSDNDATRAVFVDSLGISDAFLQSALSLNFEEARSFVDSENVSDAKIAGLCILFEEGGYTLRADKPLRAMFTRENVAGYVANLEAKEPPTVVAEIPEGANSPDAQTSPEDIEPAPVEPADSVNSLAQFGLNARKTDDGRWVISEIVLDELLSDYASRVAEGDIYYSPIVANPSGGETIVIYFEFDEGELTPRTARQLEIVSSILRLDSQKKIRLTGHTDSLGSDEYNTSLSLSRAKTVKDYLITQGVRDTQIDIVAAGESKPRRPEVTGTGEDDPTGRRANRRTEVYLDF